MSYVLLLVGFVLLIKGADFFVEGSSSVAKLLKVPSVIIGLTIVAMGTSAPEAAVSITAGLNGSNAIALGNVIGSNIFNLLMVLGICALFHAVPVEKSFIKRDFPMAIGSAVLLLIFGYTGGVVDRVEGIILLALFIGFLVLMVVSALKNRQEEEEIKVLSPLMSIVYIVGGLVAVVFGGDMVVDSATAIAQSLGLSENFIALTIVAMGTSLPELVTSVVAAKKGEVGLAVGNVVGSNIFNILLILGMSCALTPIAFAMESVIDTLVCIVVHIVMYVFCISGKEINRKEGIISIAIYLAYMVSLFMR
ncbi:MAG: calcium/sodium antiporter [Oscillospiraceae bacterium]|nr:calcium/sodium antiporter [Oscillospiraceae bacterium]